MTGPVVHPLGDAALLVEFGGGIDEQNHLRVRAALAALEDARIDGVTDLVPAFTGLAVHYDPVAFRSATAADSAPHDVVERLVRSIIERAPPAPEHDSRLVEIPVRYGGEFGPDTGAVARHSGVAEDAIGALHSAAEYSVYMIGFAPGFPYLTGLPPQLATPRRAVPRTAVPAGSVGIAGSQTGVYPFETPGGWQIIGRTTERLFDPARDPPALLRVGDRVRFVPVTV